MKNLSDILASEIFHLGKYSLKVESIFEIVLIAGVTWFLLWLIKIAINRRQVRHQLDKGNAYAFYKIIKYLLWVVAIGLIMEAIGVNVTVLIAGSAALLVGIGFGIQQTFNDVLSGIILLFEGTIRVGDILEIDNDIVIIQSIGLRTSKGMNRDEIVIIIPNSLITTNKVINWSHQSTRTRFKINVGVAYGSDVELVMKILKESALEHPLIFDKELVEGRFLDFGNSSLDFQVLFYSTNVFRIEKMKSEIRQIINRKFIENKIRIPFPQLDLHVIPDEKKGLSSKAH